MFFKGELISDPFKRFKRYTHYIYIVLAVCPEFPSYSFITILYETKNGLINLQCETIVIVLRYVKE